MINFSKELIVDSYKVLTGKEVEPINDFVEWLYDSGFIIKQNPDGKTPAEFRDMVERERKRTKRDPSYKTYPNYNTYQKEGIGAAVDTGVKEEDPDIIKDTEESG